jgi:Na+-transporting NADH:ubiquinone oxidoreductase subunit F
MLAVSGGRPLFIVIATGTFFIIGLVLSALILGAKRLFVHQELVELEINDEDTRRVKSGNSLLNVLLDEGFKIPCPCGGKAVCFQCKVRVKEGGAVQDTDRGAFSPKELASGMRLSCQCRVRDCMKLELAPSVCQAKEFSGKVLSNRNVATFIKELVVQIPDEVGLEYIPGDYLQIQIPAYSSNTSSWKGDIDECYHDDWQSFGLFDNVIKFDDMQELRAYSMASHPGEKGVVKFNIRIASPPLKGASIDPKIDWGLGSSYLFSLKKGDEVQFSGPFGESHMIDDQRDVYFLIGGAGSSFSRSHIFDLFEKATTRHVELWYGARSLKENIYQAEYESLSDNHDNFLYHIVLSEPTQEDIDGGWPKDARHCNYLFKAFEVGVLQQLESPEDALYYVCGPPMHNKSVLKLLDDYGVDQESIILDDFGN